MATTRSIKVNFKGDSCEVNIALPATIADLERALSSSAFDAELSSAVNSSDSKLYFTYTDSEGDEIVFDKDHELDLGLRMCPDLEISVTKRPAATTQLKSSAQEADQDPQKEEEIFEVSARCLRNERGVPSVTASGVKKALTLLELDPHRLVRQRLAPKRLLKRSVATAPDKVDGADGAKGAGQPSRDKDEIDGTAGVAAEDAAGSVDATVQDGISGAKERDGVISADQNVETTRLGEKAEKASPTEKVEKARTVEGVEGTSSREVPDSEAGGVSGGAESEIKSKAEEAGNDAVPAEASAAASTDGNRGETPNIFRPAVDPIHEVLVAGGVTIPPEEVEPFLNALGVRPRRFVSLGLVDRKALSEAAGRGTRDKQRHHLFFDIGGIVRDVGHFITDAVVAPRRVVHLGFANRGALREVNGRENNTERHHPFFGIGAFVLGVGHVIADAVGARVALLRRDAGPPTTAAQSRHHRVVLPLTLLPPVASRSTS